MDINININININIKGLKKKVNRKEKEKKMEDKPPYEFEYGPHDLYDIGEQLKKGYITKSEAQGDVDYLWYKTLTYEGILFQDRNMPYDGMSDDELYDMGMRQSTDFLWYYDVDLQELCNIPYYYPPVEDDSSSSGGGGESSSGGESEYIPLPTTPEDDPSKGKYYLHVFSK